MFSRDEAESLLPVIHRITERAAATLEEIKEQLRFVPSEEPLHKRLRMDQDLIVKRWAIKIARLGCEPRGVWLVDFDSKDGWFSWRYGDEGLSFFHPRTPPQTAATDAPAQKLPA